MNCLHARCRDTGVCLHECKECDPLPSGPVGHRHFRSERQHMNRPPTTNCLWSPACVCVCVCLSAADGILKLLFCEQQTNQRAVCPRSLWQAHFKKCIFIQNSEAYKVVLKALYCSGASLMLFLCSTQCCLQILKHAVSPTSVGLKQNMQPSQLAVGR